MKKITIATFVGFTNRGAEALLRTRIESIRKYCSDVDFYVLAIYVDSCDPVRGVEYIQTFGGQREKLKSLVYILKSFWSFCVWSSNAIFFRFFGFALSRNIKKLAESDLFISTDGDVLGEDYGLLPFVWRIYFLSLGIIMKKPVVIYSEGLGPFHSKIAKMIARYFFNKCVYISVRDEISRNNLLNLGGIHVPVDVVADSAFLLEEASQDTRFNHKNGNKKLIGVAVSKLAAKYGFKYKDMKDSYYGFLKFMAEVIDWLIDYHQAEIVLIPHVVQAGRDDFETAKEIKDLIKHKETVRIVDKSLNAAELKAVISHCDLIIASRMHASIAALSTGIPVVGISYSHKMKGIFRLMGVDSVVDIRELDWKITHTISEIFQKSESIRKNLILKAEEMKQKADQPGRKVAELLK